MAFHFRMFFYNVALRAVKTGSEGAPGVIADAVVTETTD